MPPDFGEILLLLAGGSSATVQSDAKQRKRPTVEGAARILKTTPHVIRRIVKAYEEGGEDAVKQLRWRAGPKPVMWPRVWGEPIKWATHKGTLYK